MAAQYDEFRATSERRLTLCSETLPSHTRLPSTPDYQPAGPNRNSPTLYIPTGYNYKGVEAILAMGPMLSIRELKEAGTKAVVVEVIAQRSCECGRGEHLYGL